jgi:hypothetical protein
MLARMKKLMRKIMAARPWMENCMVESVQWR